ncbi:hypothetical protein V7S43_008689 [Phytophthora oleae]|uniref:Uncharacterized protein n=1 Tax=Phytophthora oleae TaxID=2107226 RepID=A0ABD3FN59_9STRA
MGPDDEDGSHERAAGLLTSVPLLWTEGVRGTNAGGTCGKNQEKRTKVDEGGRRSELSRPFGASLLIGKRRHVEVFVICKCIVMVGGATAYTKALAFFGTLFFCLFFSPDRVTLRIAFTIHCALFICLLST